MENILKIYIKNYCCASLSILNFYRGDIVYDILIGLILLFLGIFLNWFFKEKLIHLWRFFSYRIFNKTVRIKGIHIRKYSIEPKSWLSCKIFDELRKKITTDTITKKKISDENMIIKSEKLGTDISISLLPEFDMSTIDAENPKVTGYKVSIELENEIRLGFRDIDDLDAFQTISEYCHEIIQKECFSYSKASKNYMIFDLIKEDRLWTKGKTKIIDAVNNAEISITNNHIELCLLEPKHLLKVIRKYFIL